MTKERVLVVSAHCDDESFGCLGMLLKHKEAGDSIRFAAFTQARNTKEGYSKMGDYFNSTLRFFDFDDQRLDAYCLQDLIEEIERIIKDFKPTIVYTNFIADLNKDHRIVSEATMVGCRPYLPDAPREVWMYEIPGSTELGFRKFQRDVSIPIDANLKLYLINKWYPKELKNGREQIAAVEHFERWPISAVFY